MVRVLRSERGGAAKGRGQGEEEDEIVELEERIKSSGLPEHAMKAAQKELRVNTQY